MNHHPYRRSLQDIYRLAVLLVLVTLLTSGCAQSAVPGMESSASTAAATSTLRRGGKLSMSLAEGDVRSWDPLAATDNMSIWTMLQIYDQLVRVAPDGRGVEPALAEKYVVSDDGRTYTFTMRRNVLFHDGTPLTIEDLRYAVERGAGEQSTWASLIPPITTISTPDDHTLVIKLAEPWAPFLADLALYAFSVIPKQQHQQRGDAFFDRPIETGPFAFDRWERGSSVLLRRNPNFWDRRYPYLDTVELQVLPDDNGRMLKFQAGELDIATNVPFNQIRGMSEDPAVGVQADPIMRVDVIVMNHARPPFDDKNVRRAINMAIDREAIVKSVLFGNGTVANSVLPRMLYWSANLATHPYDPAQAKELLAQSSRPNGFKTTLTISPGDALQRATATIVQDQLRQIGIDVAIEEGDRVAVGQVAASGKFDMFAAYLTSDIVDPDELAAIPLAPSGGLNAFFTSYKNDGLDTLIREAARTIEPDERARMYEQFQRTYSEDAVVVPLYYPHSRTAARGSVRGFTVLPTANYRLWEVWLDK